jgi:putative spermidine/putrescine transport system permease protein
MSGATSDPRGGSIAGAQRAIAPRSGRPWTFYVLATLFALYVLALYGPMICIYILSFQDVRGTIEVEVAGSPLPDAPPGARGFVGVVFRV